MYRPSVNPPETAWARHLDSVMRERDWSRVRLFEEVGAELGYRPKSRTAILKLLTGTEPDAKQAAVLGKHFGWPLEPVPAPTGATERPADLIAALTAQTDAIMALVAEMREAREREQDAAAAILAAVEVLRPDPMPRADGESTGLGAPSGTKG